MKKLLCFLGILMGTIIIFASVVQGNSLKQIEIVTGEWNPYTGNQLANKGMASEIVNNVLNDMGYNVQLTFMPFYLGYNRTKQQEFDGTFPYIKTKEREKEMWFSNQLFDVNISFFYNESNRQLKTRIESGNIQQTSDLEPYCIGLIKGYKYGQNIENLPKKRIFNTEVTAFQGLLEADNLGIKEEDSCGDGQSMEILPAEQKVGETILANYFRDKRHLVSQIKQLQFTLPVHFIMPKSDPANEKLMEDFNRSLLKLKQNGVISAILTRYAQSQTASSGLVILNGPESHPLVIGYEPISTSSQCQINSQSGWSGFFAKRRKWQQFYDENCGYLIPKGTRALVVEWGEPFLKPGNIKIHDQMLKKTRVRILEGPLKDQELYVANIYISFE